MKDFSALRCFLSDSAVDPERYRGYLCASIRLRHVTLTVEKPPFRDLLAAAATSSSSGDRWPPTSSPHHQQVWRSIGDYLLPHTYIVMTVDGRVAFRSQRFSLHEQMLASLQQEAAATSEDDPLLTPRVAYMTEHQVLSTGDNAARWMAVFDIHHPKSVVGIHLMCHDATCDEAVNEAADSYYIRGEDLQSCGARASKPLTLNFSFEVPYTSILTSEIAPVLPPTRACSMQLTLSAKCSFNSVWKCVPPRACTGQPQFDPCSGQPGPVRLLYPGGSSDIAAEPLDATARRLKACMQIVQVWSLPLGYGALSILGWSAPHLTLLALAATLGMLFSAYDLAIFCLCISLGLVMVHRYRPDTTSIDEAVDAALGSGSARTKTKVRLSNSSKDVAHAAPRQPAEESATDKLIRSLVESALPLELVQLQRWVRDVTMRWLPRLVFLHDFLLWDPQPIVAAQDVQRRILVEAEHYPSHTRGITSSELAALGFQRGNPYFYEPTWPRSNLKSGILSAFHVATVAAVLSVIGFAYPKVATRGLRLANVLWWTVILTIGSPFGSVVTRICRALLDSRWQDRPGPRPTPKI